MFEQNPLDRIEQLDAMRLGVSYRTSVKIRGLELKMRPLTITESIDVATEARKTILALPVENQTAIAEHFFLAKETLKKASTSDVDKTDFQLTDHILSRMTNDEIHYLFKQYVASVDKINPALEMMKPEEMQELVESLKKNSNEALESQLIELSLQQLVSLALHFLTKGD